jgi:glycogen operon protein
MDAGVLFAVWSSAADRIFVDIEGRRVAMVRDDDNVHRAFVQGAADGTRYSFVVNDRLLMDPRATEIDGPWTGLPQVVVPRAVVRTLPPPVTHRAPIFSPGGLVYEVAVRAFTMLHPGIPPSMRGRLAALTHPVVIAHLKKLRVSVVELMPIQAWIGERHLGPLGLKNAWGYNTMNFMAVDPRLGTLSDLREAAEALHSEGIGLILDVAFNHTGESDAAGPVLSLRGLDEKAYYRHDAAGNLTNETGCGNTINMDHPAARRLVLDSLRHFVLYAGVDGFRFDLGAVLGRTSHGFSAQAPFFSEVQSDPVLSGRLLIAEPWDVGPGGYQLGQFPAEFLEWNDRYRDNVRRFWRGDAGMIGSFVTRIAGSSDVFPGSQSRAVNFVAAHDGFTLRDLITYKEKHNEANGENNRDGGDQNYSWIGGPRDARALLATLFASRGAIMLTAGDEFGRTQRGNNNAYAQDNEITWLDWENRDRDLERYAETLAAIRASHPEISNPRFLFDEDVDWLQANGAPFDERAWRDADIVSMKLKGITVTFDRLQREVTFVEK